MMAGGMASVSSVVVEGLGVVTPPTDMGSLVVIPIPIKTRLGAISNCQLPITLEVIANDPITNYFTKKVMGNAPNYPLLFGYISN